MTNKIKASPAGNIEPPLYKIIGDKGYQIEIEKKYGSLRKQI